MIKVYADGADINVMHEMSRNKVIQGWTTNPSLMRKAGVKNYRAFAERAVAAFPNQPISFEVISDDFAEMESQAWQIAGWGENCYVKIPVCNTRGASSAKLINRLSEANIKINCTAVLCYAQIDEVLDALGTTPAVVSIFAGRIADTGRDPVPIVRHALKKRRLTIHEILWASPRQALDVYTADSIGCDIITVGVDILDKLKLEGRNLMEYSRATVQQFFDDAEAAGYTL